MVLVNGVAASKLLPNRFRPRVLNRLGMDIHRNVLLEPGLTITQTRKITMGEGCVINMGCTIDGNGSVVLGRNVRIAVGVSILTGTHLIGAPQQRAGDIRSHSVRMGDGVWVGAHAVIFPGVTVGAGAIVAAGAVVRHDVPPNVIVAGVPARTVEHLV